MINRTVLVIAHRLSTVRNADQVSEKYSRFDQYKGQYHIYSRVFQLIQNIFSMKQYWITLNHGTNYHGL